MSRRDRGHGFQWWADDARHTPVQDPCFRAIAINVHVNIGAQLEVLEFGVAEVLDEVEGDGPFDDAARCDRDGFSRIHQTPAGTRTAQEFKRLMFVIGDLE